MTTLSCLPKLKHPVIEALGHRSLTTNFASMGRESFHAPPVLAIRCGKRLTLPQPFPPLAVLWQWTDAIVPAYAAAFAEGLASSPLRARTAILKAPTLDSTLQTRRLLIGPHLETLCADRAKVGIAVVLALSVWAPDSCRCQAIGLRASMKSHGTVTPCRPCKS